jgi:hypothetical protein
MSSPLATAIDLRGLLAASTTPWFLMDPGGKLLFVNPALRNRIPHADTDPGWMDRLGERLGPPPAATLAGRVTRTEFRGDGAPEPRGTSTIATSSAAPAPGATASASAGGGEADSDRPETVVWLPIVGAEESSVGVMGCLTAGEPPAGVPSAADRKFRELLDRHRREQVARYGFHAFPAASPAMTRVLEQVRLAAATRAPVLIVGEPGTGRRELARLIHHQGGPKRGSLRELDPGITPVELLRREFAEQVTAPDSPANEPTTSRASGVGERSGFDESAWRALEDDRPLPTVPRLLTVGTILLHRPSQLPADLLDLLAGWVRQPSGNARWIAIESTDADSGASSVRWPAELRERFSVLRIELPPLRQRLADLPLLLATLLEELRGAGLSAAHAVDPAALAAFSGYSWPGNLTELRETLIDARRRGAEGTVRLEHLPERIRAGDAVVAGKARDEPGPALDAVLEGVERRLLTLALDRFKGNKAAAAEWLGVPRARFLRRIESLRLT